MGIFAKGRREGYDYDACATVEGKRLRTQAQLLAGIDKPLYKGILAKYPNATVLDIGCNEGDSAMDRLAGLDVAHYIGIDVSRVAIANAKKKYADANTHFVELDITHPNAQRDLTAELNKIGINQVDFINISLVLLHLTEPEFILEKVYPFLKRGGTIFVKDIDDRDNSANLDDQHWFADSYKIADANRDSGNRNVGREIPNWLKRYGYRNVNCIMRGLTSRGMNAEQKQALWDTYYGFFTEDTLQECEYTNGSKQSLLNLGWCNYYLPKMHEIFMMPSFEFTLGFCVYTATKEE